MTIARIAGLLALAAGAGSAQTLPTLAVAGGQYLLQLPYLETGSGASRQAGRATLSAANLAVFTVDAASVAPVALQAPGAPVPRFESAATGWRLSLPYLEARLAGDPRAYAVQLDTSDASRFVVDVASIRELALLPATAPTGLVLNDVNRQTVGSSTFGSSTRLELRWTPPPGPPVDHYELLAIDSVTGSRIGASVAGTASAATLAALKSATAYAVTVRACLDVACSRAALSAPATAETAAEVWQLQGTGHSVATLRQPVADGNARLSATRFGADAGGNADSVQFYYGPRGISGLAVAASGAVSAAASESWKAFTSLASTSGVRSPAAPASGLRQINTGQGVPLSTAMGGKVRLFFEGEGTDGRTRIYSIDSADGWLGRDFNRSPTSTLCNAAADYLAGGNCPATLEIGVDGETGNGTARIRAARQHKLGFPTQDDWRWNGAAGSFMVFTIDATPGCTTASHNHAYAVWDGRRFVVQTLPDGCPKSFASVQAAVPMHLGDARYKLYYGDPSITVGRIATSALPFVGPKKLIYADGSSTGAPSAVDFEDWEPVARARGVHFLWPDGQRLDDAAEGYIDDFHFLALTSDLELQVLYLSITDGSVIPFAAVAVLLNP